MTTPPGREPRLGDLIKLTGQSLAAVQANALREFDLTVPQYSAMRALSYAPGVSGAMLARVCLVTPQTMATVLANLEAKGLIRRNPSPVHQKVLVIHLTRHGQALIRKADAKAMAIEAKLDAAYADEERPTFTALLERAVAALGEAHGG